MPQRIMGLDVGAWSIKAVLVEDSIRGFRVLGALEERVPPGPDETLAERRAAALRALLETETARREQVSASFPAELATVRFVTLPYSEPKKIELTLPGELADLVPFDLDQSLVTHQVVASKEGSSTSVAVVVQKDRLKGYLDLLAQVSADPRHLSVDTLAQYNLYSNFLRNDGSKAAPPSAPAPESETAVAPSPGGPPDARLVVDVGHERTLLTACGPEGVAYTRVLRTGGRAVTEALAARLQLPLAEAEALKQAEGFVASARQPAPTEAAQAASDAVAAGLTELVRELRRTLSAIRADRRVRVARIDLVGGGSRLRNLANYLADQLNVPTAHAAAVEQLLEPHVAPGRRPAFAGALAAAVRVVGEGPLSTLDLRVGEFEFAGQLQGLRSRLPAIAAAAAGILLLLGIHTAVSYVTISRAEAKVDAEFCKITKQTIGREICEPKIALTAMQEPSSELGNVSLPERTALDVAAELSARVPEKLEVKVGEMDVTPDRARLKGEAPNFDAVDQLVEEYEKERCFSNIKKSGLRKTPDGTKVEFQLTLELKCSESRRASS